MENISDHNREEAFKAKKIALEKMENNDFRDAKETIHEAQELCPELANYMSQMLTICDIHCAAESIDGDEKDLYGILQVEEKADETMITKQYRKIALSTHPDKNSFPGAQEAFKLVAEAYSVLSDPAKRTEHDWKRIPTFWTRCHHCEYRFQYPKRALNLRLPCQQCKKKFTACHLEDPEPPMPEHDWKRKTDGSQNVQKNEANKKKPEVPMTTSSSGTISDFEVSENMSQDQQHDSLSEEAHPVKSSSESEGHTSTGGLKKSNKSEGSDRIKQHLDGKLSHNDSDGNKREREIDYSCNIGMICDEILEDDITSGDSESSQNLVSSNINVQELTEGNDSVVVEKSYSDPAIKVRDINSLTYNHGGVDQIWALRDNNDHMPRSYAKIKCVGHSKWLYWLKFYPLSEEEKEQNKKSLPVACGKFCLGEKVDSLEYSSLFSHTVECKEICVNPVSGGRGSAKTKLMVYEIYPKRAEVWALYKGWSKQWNSSDADNNKKRSYEYEVVEVLSDMSDVGGANVIPLIRIEGFASLLVAAKDKLPYHIPSSEVFRFSHRIPYYRVSGHENVLKKINGPILERNPIVPEGFLLLDSSCLPSDTEATFPSMDLDTYISQRLKRSRKESQREIFPQPGEIWAIYMDWESELSLSSTDCCELAVGEIIERNDASTRISFLANVEGYTAVFKHDKQKGVLDIPTGEILRFSHQIPASFRVMKEKGSKRRVFYDLDPAYLLTGQDHTNSSGNSASVEDLTKKQKTTADQAGPRRMDRRTRPNSHYIGPLWQ